MAYSNPSTKETTNYARLCRLLIDIGSQALRETFNRIHGPESLHTFLERNISTLQKLKKQRVLNAIQWSKLFPAIATSVTSANFDITLVIVLLRSICGLAPPITTGSWDKFPPATDVTCEADIVRLKCFRNDIYAHAEKASVPDSELNTHWHNIRESLVRLGGESYEREIDNLQTECMDPEIEQYYKELLEEWKKDEDNIKDALNEIKNEIGTITKKLDDFTAANTPTKGTLNIAIDVDSITFKDAQNRDPAQEEEVKRKLMSEMTKKFFESRADKIPVKDIPHHLCNYLEGILDLPIRRAHEGSLIITVECRTLEILERLWDDYSSGHLNSVVEECLVTDDIRRRFGIEIVRLKTSILEDEYLMCKLSLMGLTDTQKEQTVQQGMQQFGSDDLVEADSSTAADDGQPLNTQHPISVIHGVTPSEDSLRIDVKCLTLESLERLWQDYRSGHLNRVAEELLVTDDIKRKFDVESITLKTTISEADYLACKEYLSNRPDAAGNHQLVAHSNGMSQSPSSHRRNDEGAVIPHAEGELMHHDPLEAHGNVDGGEHPHPVCHGSSETFGEIKREMQQKFKSELPPQQSSETHQELDKKITDKKKTPTSGQPLGQSSLHLTDVSEHTQGGKDKQGRGRASQKGSNVTAERLLANCQKELQKEMTAATKCHTKKIEKVSSLLKRLRIQKHVQLDEFERVHSEKEALKQRKEDLESQRDEFQRFEEKVISCLIDHKGQPFSSVESTIGELRNAVVRECHRLETALPVYARKTTIIETVKENQVCVVLGETGSGKSTQLTQYLYEAGLAETGLIVCTQPRKVAATSLAAHVAHEMGGVVGQVVGCHVGGSSQTSENTSIMYVTDHFLLNECLKDPSLSKYSCIIIDEAHERSLYSDLLLGMIKKSLAHRPELRVVITSATIDPALFVTYFDQCPVLKVSGRVFPVDVVWKDDPTSNGENYLQEAVSTVREIHHKEGPGDILVFLTSQVETERACEDLRRLEADDPSLVCLPLHGKLRQEEQRRVFEEYVDKRKVIFATNCAETSITVPGIRYVVDTGMVKEMTYEPKRNKSCLEVTTISKSSAEQRKGRAGRTEAGKCYRLYSEEDYAVMEDRSKPEILRVHLGQAVLKLMELGIENITDFEFVEAPPLESIKLALDTLKSLGAIANGQLTELGHKIARVPLEPHLAKLLFDGIDQGVGSEALALAAIATVSSSVFFRVGSEKENHTAGSGKVGFCHNGGDLLTLLEVYRQYLQQPRREKKKWASENSLSEQSLRLTEETVKELKLALKHELNIKVPDASQHIERTDLKLQIILVSCLVNNLCVFTGHPKAGYRVVSINHCVQLHPSSALQFLGATPQFIVFEKLLKTSRDFAINVTPVEEKWLQEMISEGIVKYDLEELMSTVLTEVALPCSPDLMALAFGRFRRGIIDQVEEKVSKRCNDSLVVLEKNEESGQVKMFVPPNYAVKASSVLEGHLEKSRKLLRDEQREQHLREDCQGSRIVWGQGGEVQELLTPHMYRTVTVSEIEDDALIILDYLKSFGEIVQYQLKKQNGKIQVFATFKYSKDASMAVKGPSSASLDADVNVQPCHVVSDSTHGDLPQFKVRAEWFRRRCKGTGSIQFFNTNDFSNALANLSSLLINSSMVSFRADKYHEGQLFMWRLHPQTLEVDVKSAIEERLANLNVKVKRVIFHREPEFDTSDETLSSQKQSFEETLLSNRGIFATEGQFSVDVRKPSPKDLKGTAILTFQDIDEGQSAVRVLNGKRISGIGIVTLKPQFSTILLCPNNIYAVVEHEVQALMKDLDQACGTKLAVVRSRKDNQVTFKIKSDSTEQFIRATIALNKILNGDRFECKTPKTIDILLTKSVKDVLQAIGKDTGTVITQDRKNKVVRIHGREATSRESAKRAVDKFLDDCIRRDSHSWQIQLRGPDKPRGLLKDLFKKFGLDLKGLKDIPGVQQIHVEFRNHVLEIQSSDEARETVNRYVEECCQNLPQESSSLSSETKLTCGLCLCDLDGAADVYRLACCGHAYDKDCVIQQLNSADYPLKCATENCEELLVLRDLQNLLSESERKKLATSALDEYVKRNPEIVKYCPTADCHMVYHVSTKGKRFACGACQAVTCTSCHVQWHNGLTCAMFKPSRGASRGATRRVDDAGTK